MALGTLSIDLEARVAQFERDMGAAARASEKTASQIAGALGVIRSAVGGLAAGIGVGGLLALTRNVNAGVDALNDLKDATGSSIENLSALEDVAARTGTPLEAVSTSLLKFNQALSSAKPGSEAAQAFELLGLSVRELKALDPAEALRQTAVALAGFADDGNKARLTQELFGKSLREVAPFLADLAKQSELVATVTNEEAEAAERFNQELARMEKAALDVSRALVGPLVSGINVLIDKFREGKAAGDNFLVTLLKQSEIARLLRLNTPGSGFSGTGTNSGLAALTGSTQIGSGDYDRSAARLLRQGKLSVGEITAAVAKGARKAAGDGIAPVTTELDRYLDTLERQLEKEKDLTELQKAQIRISEAGAQGFSEAKRDAVLALAKQIDKQRELNKAEEEALKAQEERIRIGRDFAAEQGVDNSGRAARLAQLAGQSSRGRDAARQADLELLKEELDRFQRTDGLYGISPEDYADQVKALFGIADERLEKTKSLAEELGLSFTSAFEDAVVGGKNLGQVLRGLGQDMARLVLRQTVTEPLGSWFSGVVKNLLPSFDGGGSTGFGPRIGGLDGKGGFLSLLHPQESIVDHTRGQGAGAVSVVINQSVGSHVTLDMLAQNNQQLVRQIQAGIAASVTRGGALA